MLDRRMPWPICISIGIRRAETGRPVSAIIFISVRERAAVDVGGVVLESRPCCPSRQAARVRLLADAHVHADPGAYLARDLHSISADCTPSSENPGRRCECQGQQLIGCVEELRPQRARYCGYWPGEAKGRTGRTQPEAGPVAVDRADLHVLQRVDRASVCAGVWRVDQSRMSYAELIAESAETSGRLGIRLPASS